MNLKNIDTFEQLPTEAQEYIKYLQLKKEIKKNRPKETWIKGYNKHKKDYDKWKEETCPHN